MSSSPPRRASEPPSLPPSLLQSILEYYETGTTNSKGTGHPSTSTGPAGRSKSVLVSRRSTGLAKRRSVWIPSSKIAKDARDKLRALDERRYLGHQRNVNTGNVGKPDTREAMDGDGDAASGADAEANAVNMTSEVPDGPSSAVHISFNTVDFARATSSDTSDETPQASAGLRLAQPDISPPQSPGMTSKNTSVAAGLDYDFPEQDEVSPEQRAKRPSITRHDTITVIASAPAEAIQKPPPPASTERIRRANRISDSFLPTTTSNRYALPIVKDTPATTLPQARSMSVNTPPRSPLQTPTWMRPFQLVTTDRAIHMHQHGDV